MLSIDAIIRAKGGFEVLAENPITVAVPGYMPLTVEAVGPGPRGGTRVAVHHTREMNGDLVFDPEVVFEVKAGEWHPLTFEMSGVVYQEAVFRDDDGRLMCAPALLKDLQAFCRMWDRNIRDQGFVAAAG